MLPIWNIAYQPRQSCLVAVLMKFRNVLRNARGVPIRKSFPWQLLKLLLSTVPLIAVFLEKIFRSQRAPPGNCDEKNVSYVVARARKPDIHGRWELRMSSWDAGLRATFQLPEFVASGGTAAFMAAGIIVIEERNSWRTNDREVLNWKFSLSVLLVFFCQGVWGHL